ncbi:MAG: class II aldolase/adducin family protein [Nitrospirae bacterium]|nr:class II aldolase/adducin family protein [Nitrospirota bacterium]
MKKLLGKYNKKIVSQGLADEGNITLLGLDAEVSSNRPMTEIDPELVKVFDHMNISSLLYAEPAEPYRSILAYYGDRQEICLMPTDCETRTFLHDIPVVPALTAAAISRALSARKAAIVGNRGVVSSGTVSPEQAFVSFSSVCFSIYVKFFSDVMFHLEDRRTGKTPENRDLMNAYSKIAPMISLSSRSCADIPAAPPSDEQEVYQQLILTGRQLVERKLVDSYFGNISYVFRDTMYISQTGSSLDELDTCIDAVPLDGSSSSGITASSELSAHISVYKKTGRRAIVHGHPKFTVIMSMSCRKEGCDLSTCYRACREQRAVSGIPIVSGEIGTGPTGLARTVPEAMGNSRAVIVFGHGIFSVSDDTFRPAFELMQSTEYSCMKEYFKKIQGLI